MNVPKTVLDCGAGVLAFGAVLDRAPAVAALLSIIWLGFRLYEYARWRMNGRKGRMP